MKKHYVVVALMAVMGSLAHAELAGYTQVDVQSIAVEGRCLEHPRNAPDYVYPGRQCYTQAELQYSWAQLEAPTDGRIREVSKKLRAQALKKKLKKAKKDRK